MLDGMPSPTRRSARAVPTPTRAVGAPSASSSSSIASSRHDRKLNGITKSSTPHSRSSEDTSEPPRRSQRAHAFKDDASTDRHENADGHAEEDEEVTRCICEYAEYPGPPQSEAFQGIAPHSDDLGGLFIQCDGCSVWQHGGCVGIIEESQSPDKYYCEECRPKLHELHVDARGQKYSLYRPLHTKSARKTSMSKSDEKAKREREALLSRASTDPVTGKRRATMRSKEHDDEEEQLRRALEESRKEVEGPVGIRKSGKRGRDDSEDSKVDNKRLRTVSESIPSISHTESHEAESDIEGTDGLSTRLKKVRSEPTHIARHAGQHEKAVEKEKMRMEAAGRRQERAGRRRADDIHEDSEAAETKSPALVDITPRSSQPPSPPPSGNLDRVASLKKSSGRKGKKQGNNQYTKPRDGGVPPSPHSKRREAGGSSGEEHAERHEAIMSREVSKNSPTRELNGNGRGGRIGKGRHKGMNGIAKQDEVAERTLVNMKRSLDVMMTFVSRQQIDMAGDRTPIQSSTPRAQPALPLLIDEQLDTTTNGLPLGGPDASKPFDQLNAMEMADVFSRNVEKWNRLYSHLV